MKLTMLGTGNAVTTNCYNTCFLIEDDSQTKGNRFFLVDGGGGIGLLRQLKAAGKSWKDIHSIFVTHRHMDHITGIFWMFRMILSGMKNGSYKGETVIYAHDEVINILNTVPRLLLTEEECAFIGDRLKLIAVEDGECQNIIGHDVTFFDIHSTKAKQFGFKMELESSPCGDGSFLVCCGDEPISENAKLVSRDAKWLLHEAFCLEADAERYRPREKSHSSVRDACITAEELGVQNLLLYHTEDSDIPHRKERYCAEGSLYFSGRLFVPDDLEELEL